MLGAIADILGIISFIMTIILLIYSESLRKQIHAQRKDYREQQHDIRIVLQGFRDSVYLDNLQTMQVRSGIRTALMTYTHNYKYVLSWRDRRRIRQAINLMSPDAQGLNKEVVCEHLDYLIARFSKNEV